MLMRQSMIDMSTIEVFDFALQRKCTYFHDVLTGSRDKVQKLNSWLD